MLAAVIATGQQVRSRRPATANCLIKRLDLSQPTRCLSPCSRSVPCRADVPNFSPGSWPMLITCCRSAVLLANRERSFARRYGNSPHPQTLEGHTHAGQSMPLANNTCAVWYSYEPRALGHSFAKTRRSQPANSLYKVAMATWSTSRR